MRLTELKNRIWEIAQANPNGFTYNIRKGRLEEKGLVAAYEATQNSFGYESLERVIEHALTHDGIVGGWLNRKTNQFYFDSSKIFLDEFDAEDFARANKQIAYYNLEKGYEINITR